MKAKHILMLGDDNAVRRRERICWVVALVVGFLQAWGRRHVSADGVLYVGADSIAYLDQGDAWLRGDWPTAVNAMWSPLYPWLTGLTLWLVKPTPYQEFTVVRLLNFIIYAGALAAFAYCLRGLLNIRGAHVIHRNAQHDEHDDAGVRGWLSPQLMLLLGYALFIWTSLQMNRVARISPDLIVAALVYLAAALLLRIRAGRIERHTFVLLGLVLGLGYLAKTIMFPLAFVYLACAYFAGRPARRVVLRVLLALFVFLLIAGPFVFVLSRAKQRLTIGDSARLNYAWYVNRVPPFTHWQGDPASSGTPAHPTRKLFTAPDVYEFAGPVGGTYPPWYDPTYWYEGVTPHFNLEQQLRALARNLFFLARYSLYRFFLAAVCCALALLFYLSGRGRRVLRDIAAYRVLLIPALAAGTLYLLVNVEARYLAPFVTLLALGLFAAVSPPADERRQRVVLLTVWAVILIGALSLAPAVARDAVATVRDAVSGSARFDVQWQVAAELDRRGVRAGAPVAVVGDAMYAAWPRLARARVVAELPAKPANNVAMFWTLDEARRQQVVAACAQTGAQLLVANDVPVWATQQGWQRIGDTNYYLLMLSR